MTESGRRARKKAATRRNIADTARRLFEERGYDAVGIRDVAAAADVAVTTVFAHFASKEALVFEQDDDVEDRLARAVTDRKPGEPVVPALRREILALVRHCTGEGAPLWQMIDASPALQKYEQAMRRRHAEVLAAALAADPGSALSATAGRAVARFVVDAFSVAREAEDPEAAVGEIFPMIEAAWRQAAPD